jgi:ferric-dicitrate binding protein FerR (iron transport regulator)
VPTSTRGRRAWRQAAAIKDYRRTYGISNPDRALGPAPRAPAQRAPWRQARQAALAGVLAAVGLGWRLRFQLSADTRAWRRGAIGE